MCLSGRRSRESGWWTHSPMPDLFRSSTGAGLLHRQEAPSPAFLSRRPPCCCVWSSQQAAPAPSLASSDRCCLCEHALALQGKREVISYRCVAIPRAQQKKKHSRLVSLSTSLRRKKGEGVPNGFFVRVVCMGDLGLALKLREKSPPHSPPLTRPPSRRRWRRRRSHSIDRSLLHHARLPHRARQRPSPPRRARILIA